jgi:hypothetical protein
MADTDTSNTTNPTLWPIPEIGSEVPRKALEHQSQEFKDRIDQWEFFRHSDELTGGYAASVETYTESTDAPTFTESYLIPHEKEDDEEFAKRVAKAVPPRFVQEGITSIVGVLTQQAPNRSEYPDEITDWMEQVTPDGLTWHQWINMYPGPLVQRYGLCYGMYRRPSIGGATLGEQEALISEAGLPKVLAQVINPEALEWWETDDTGVLQIVRYVEPLLQDVYESGYVVDTKDVTRHWFVTHEGWWYVDDAQGDSTGANQLIVGDAGHWIGPGQPLENFPITKWHLKDDRGPTEPASYAQLAYYRAESELMKIEESSAFSMTWVPIEASDQNPTETVKGPDTVGGFPSEGKHVPMMLEPSGVSFEHFVNNRLPALEAAALSPYGRNREVGQNDSGVALAHIQETAVNIYRQHAKSFAASEFAALQPIAELLGTEMPIDARAEWPRQFGTLSDSKQMENLKEFLDSEPGEVYERHIMSAMADASLPDLTQREKEEAQKSYEDQQKKAEEERLAFESEMDDQIFDEGEESPIGKPAAMNPKQAGGGPTKER